LRHLMKKENRPLRADNFCVSDKPLWLELNNSGGSLL
jgi:hypothetical protein